MIRRLLAFVAVAILAAAPAAAQSQPDPKPRIAIMSAFAPEWTALKVLTAIERSDTINGVEFVSGKLAGRDVVLFLSGISMVNAAMTSQLVFDRFNVSHLLINGIAGGVNPELKIGDETTMRSLGVTSKLSIEIEFLELLRALGRTTAERWLGGNYDAIGQRSSVDIREKFL